MAHWEKLAAAIVLIFLVVAIKFWPQPTLSELGRQAQSALADGNYTLAYSAYRQAVALAPAAAKFHLGLARVYEATGDFAQATEEVRIAHELSPSAALLKEIDRLTALRDEAKNIRADLAEVGEILSRHPDFRDGWVHSAYDLYRLKDDAGAKKALDRALELDPNYEPALQLKTYLR